VAKIGQKQNRRPSTHVGRPQT